MKKLILALTLLVSVQAFALTVPEAFARFYNSSLINSRMCGMNTHYFLKYLRRNNISYKKGFVVAVYEDFAQLNHFDGRWGSKEVYSNGDIYYRSNWYFHVFAIIDGMAYDFSQAGPKVMPFRQYLRKAYIPKTATENIFFQGVLTPKTELKKYQNLKMTIHNAYEYGIKVSEPIYEGKFIELFNM